MGTTIKHIAFAIGLLTACTDQLSSHTTAIETVETGEQPSYDSHCALEGEVPKGGFFTNETKCKERDGEVRAGKATCDANGHKGVGCKWEPTAAENGACLCIDETIKPVLDTATIEATATLSDLP